MNQRTYSLVNHSFLSHSSNFTATKLPAENLTRENDFNLSKGI